MLNIGRQLDKAFFENFEIVHSLDQNVLVDLDLVVKVHTVQNEVVHFLVF